VTTTAQEQWDKLLNAMVEWAGEDQPDESRKENETGQSSEVSGDTRNPEGDEIQEEGSVDEQ